MPAARPRKTKTPESVPNHGDPDRKRVLNVLAQRRYRQRRRERIATLEVQASTSSSVQDDHESRSNEQRLGSGDFGLGVLGPSQEDAGTVEQISQSIPGTFMPLSDFDQDPFDLSLMEFTHLPSPLPSTSSPPPNQFPLAPDGAVLSIPILGAVRAFASVAMALDVVSHIWDPSYLHVLPPYIPAIASLPANLHPVPAQLIIPHHPMLDLLPWPSVREKLICMLSMPSALRPPVAQEDEDDEQLCQLSPGSAATHVTASNSGGVKQSTAIMQLKQDLDDFKDGVGVRVHGNTTTWGDGNELMEDAWEIGDLFYKKWWWCLDQRIVEASNRRRRERGLPRLRMVS